MKIVILTMRTVGNIFLVNSLLKEFDAAGMVLLTPVAKTKQQVKQLWAKRLKQHGFFKTINKLLFHKFPCATSGNNYAQNFFFPEGGPIEYNYTGDILQTTDINSIEVERFIKDKGPDVIAVCGSNVIKPNIFTIPSKGTINIHCGITPDYRCANPVEWAIYDQSFEKVGVTIHYVNEGLDTGDIIYQKSAGIQPGDSIESLYCKNIKNGTELMIKALKDLDQNAVNSIKQPVGKGKHYPSIDFGYLQNRRVHNILRTL